MPVAPDAVVAVAATAAVAITTAVPKARAKLLG
jgi:hypothetical protein